MKCSTLDQRLVRVALTAVVLGLFFTSLAPAQTPPQYYVDAGNVKTLIGADELMASPGVTVPGYWNLTSYFNSGYVAGGPGKTHKLLVHTGRFGSGCRPATGGLDNVIVFHSNNQLSGFTPRNVSSATPAAPYDRWAFRSSITTDRDSNNNCDGDNFLWGLGSIVQQSGGTHLATFDLSENGSDTGKKHFLLASHNGFDWINGFHEFLDVSNMPNTLNLNALVVDPVVFKISTNKYGVIFNISKDDFTCTSAVPCGLGYLYIDFTSFPSGFNVHVLNASGNYELLGANRKPSSLGYLPGTKHHPGLAATIRLDLQNFAHKIGSYYVLWGSERVSSKARIKYRAFNVNSSTGAFTSWGWARYLKEVVSGNNFEAPLPNGNALGYLHPMPVFTSFGGVLYFSHDTDASGWTGLDVKAVEFFTSIVK